MLSPSHPGPHKATHLAMCDRTLLNALGTVVDCDIGTSRRPYCLRVRLLAMSVPTARAANFCSFTGVELKKRPVALTITCASWKVIHLLG